jgi:hypothetical protein
MSTREPHVALVCCASASECSDRLSLVLNHCTRFAGLNSHSTAVSTSTARTVFLAGLLEDDDHFHWANPPVCTGVGYGQPANDARTSHPPHSPPLVRLRGAGIRVACYQLCTHAKHIPTAACLPASLRVPCVVLYPDPRLVATHPPDSRTYALHCYSGGDGDQFSDPPTRGTTNQTSRPPRSRSNNAEPRVDATRHETDSERPEHQTGPEISRIPDDGTADGCGWGCGDRARRGYVRGAGTSAPYTARRVSGPRAHKQSRTAVWWAASRDSRRVRGKRRGVNLGLIGERVALSSSHLLPFCQPGDKITTPEWPLSSSHRERGKLQGSCARDWLERVRRLFGLVRSPWRWIWAPPPPPK